MVKKAKNLLANGKNNITTRANNRANMLADVQTNAVNRTSATNLNAISTPTRPDISRPVTNLNLQKAQQPVQTKLDNLNTQTGVITGNNPAFVNGQLRPHSTNQVLNDATGRFIGFQNPTPAVQNTTITATGPEGKSFGKLNNGGYMYVPSDEQTARINNANVEANYTRKVTALDDLQQDIYKLKRTLTESEIRNYYPELNDNMDDVMKLQKEIKPILAKGNMVTTEWLEQRYSQLLSSDTKNLEEVKQKSESSNKNLLQFEKNVNHVLETDWQSLSPDGIKYVKDASYLLNAKNEAKKQGVVGKANDREILDYLLKNNTELQKVAAEMKGLELTDMDRAIIGWEDANNFRRELANMSSDLIGLSQRIGLSETSKPTDEEMESVARGKEKLSNDFWSYTGKKIATELGVSLDSLEKSVYRIYKDMQNEILERGADFTKDYFTKRVKSALKDSLGVELTDEQADAIKNLYDKGAMPSIEEKIKTNRQNVKDYIESVNKDYENKKAKNLDPDIENYANSRSMTSMLLQGDISPFLYKSSGEAAQNADMAVMVLAGTVAPEIVLPAMALDSYLRESQEAFEELSNVGADYEQAQRGAAIVGLASSAVELGLESFLGGVETTASNAFHDMFMKDFKERATKMVAEKGLAELLKQGAVTQFKSSLEEGLEEVFQQAIHNRALQEYDPDQKLTEGLLEAFEGGFYNWMNLLAGGGDVMSNVQQNSANIQQTLGDAAYNAGVNTRNIVDTVKDTFNRQNNRQNVIENINNKVTTNQTTENQNTSITPVNNAITPVNNAITTTNNNINEADDGVIELKDVTDLDENIENEETENQTTELAEGLGDKVWDSLSGIEENTRNRMKKNPYSAQENKRLIDTIESDPGIDINDYMLDRYDEVLNSIEKSLDKEENRRKDVGKLYQKLEETNAPIDATNLKNKIPQFQQKMEDLGDILSSSDQSKVKTILENIQQIGDGTMDVWKARKIADQWSKRGEASTDGLRLIREIRDSIDEEIRNQRPEMKEVDQEYRKSLDDIRDLKGNLANKRTGEFKGNAVNIVKNMLSGTNRAYLTKLEKYIPGIKQRLQAIRDVKFVFNAYETGNGSRFQSGIGKAVFGNIFKFLGATGGIPGVIAGAVADAGVEAGMKSLTRKALRETVLQETERSRAELEKINQKIEEGKQLEAQDKQKLKEIGEKIVKNAEEAKKTKAEQDAWNKYFEDIKNQQALPEGIKLTKVTEINKPTTPKKPKNKVTSKKSTKSVDKNISNQYITTNASSTDSSVDLSQNEEKATGTKNSSSLAKPRGGELEGPTTVFSEKPKTGKTQTIGANFDISNVKQEYKDNFDKVINGEAKELPVGRIDGSLADDGQERDAIFSEATNTKVDRDHGIDKSNLLGTINKPDYIIKDLDRAKAKNPETYKEKINLIRKIPGTNNFVLVAAERQNGFFILTNYEVHRNNANKMMKEIRGYAKRGIIALDTIGDLTEALNKVTGGKNAVTNKNNKKSETKTEVKEAPKTETKQEENQTLTKVDNKAQPTQKQRKLIYEWLNKQNLDRENPFVPMLMNDIATQGRGVWGYVYGAISQILGYSGIDFNKATDFFKSIGIDPEGWEKEMEIAPTYYIKGKVVNEKKSQQSESKNIVTNNAKATEKKQETVKLDNIKKFSDFGNILNPLVTGEADATYVGKINGEDVVVFKTPSEYYVGKGDVAFDNEKGLPQSKNGQYVKTFEGVKAYLEDGLRGEDLTKFDNEIQAKEQSKRKATDTAKNKVTNIKVEKGEDVIPDNSSITGRFRNLTLDEYRAMQEVEGLEDIYLKEDPDTIDKLIYFKDAMGRVRTVDYGLPDDFELDYKSYPVRSMAENIVYLQQLKERIENNETTEEDRQRSDYYLGENKKNKGSEWDIEGLEREQKSDIGSILEYVGFENIDKGLIDDYYNSFVDLIEHETQFDRKDNQEKRDNFKKVYDKYGEWWKLGDSEYQWETYKKRATDIYNLDNNNEYLETPEEVYDQLAEKEGIKNKVTSKKTESKPKNLVTSKTAESTNTEFETLPEDISIEREAKEMGPKRIAPDRVPRQQLTFEEGVNKINDNLKTIAEYMKLRSEFYTAGNYNDSDMKHRLNTLEKDVQQILYGGKGFQFKSSKSKEFTDLWKNIKDNIDNSKGLDEVGKTFYISKVKKDISKGYVYPQKVLDKIPGAKKAINDRERYQKGLDTSFSAKDERIDYSEKDKIGAGIKSQDGKQVTKEQKDNIVKGVMDFQKVFGINMKKIAEDLGFVYVDLHGGAVFLSQAVGMYRRTFNKDGTVKNSSVSVGGSEVIRWKDKKTGERKTEQVNTTMSHELGHVVDHLVEDGLFGWQDMAEIRPRYKHDLAYGRAYAKYLDRDTEVVARAFEQYMDVAKGGNLYYDQVGYWSKSDFENYVKPIVEKNIKNKLGDWYIDPNTIKYQKVTSNAKNKITSKQEVKSQPEITKKQLEQLADTMKKTGLASDVMYHDSLKDFTNYVNGTVDTPRLQRVRHGSQNSFEKFDNSYMGDGQGTQHHGYGFYVTKNKNIAKSYAELRDPKTRNLYEIEIPDSIETNTPTGKNYLEEAGKLTKKQRNMFRDAIKDLDDSKKEHLGGKIMAETIPEWIQGDNGWYLYKHISNVLGGDKNASKFLEDMGYDGIHYVGKEDGNAYVIFNDDTLDITNHIQYLRDNNGDIAGAVTPDGVVHLILPNLRADTVAHEFSHLLRSYAKQNNSDLFNAINKIAQEAPQELKDYVKRTYGDLSEDAFLDEVFAWRQGQYSGIKSAQTWYERMWNAIKELWDSVKSKFGKQYADLSVFDAYEKMSSEELMNKVDSLLKGGKEIGQGKGSETRYERTEGNLNDLKREYYRVISPNYEISSWDDANLHGALDYMLDKKGIENTGKSILRKFRALNSKLPKIKNGDDITNLSPIDQFGYDLKDKIIETYIKKKNIIVKDRDNRNKGDGAYPNHTYVLMEIGNYTAKPHISEFLYTKLKEEGYIR